MLQSIPPAVLLLATLTGCVTGYGAGSTLRATLPASAAWYDGHKVFYVTTDTSDRALSEQMRANFAPRLRDGVPEYPKPPEVRTVLERVYKFSDNTQDSIFASAPEPLGDRSRNQAYSPLWVVYEVHWVDPAHIHTLESEEAVLQAQGDNQVAIERTDIVVNCPIVGIDDRSLPGVRLFGRR
jgi:hypothetical protein